MSKLYCSAAEIEAWCSAIQSDVIAQYCRDAWRRGENIHQLGFVIDGILFDQWIEKWREDRIFCDICPDRDACAKSGVCGEHGADL